MGAAAPEERIDNGLGSAPGQGRRELLLRPEATNTHPLESVRYHEKIRKRIRYLGDVLVRNPMGYFHILRCKEISNHTSENFPFHLNA